MRQTAAAGIAAAGVAVAVSVAVIVTGCDAVSLDAVSLDPGSLARDLVAHWAFDQTGGTVVTDSSGNRHDALLTGGTWVDDGRFGGALRMTAGDRATVASFPPATSGWTVSVWVRSSAADLAASTSEFATIISTETQFSGGWQIALDNRSGEQRFVAAYWAAAGFNDYVRAFCSCVEADRWVHLTAVWDAERATMSLYQDEHEVSQVPMPTRISTGDTTLFMGTWNQLGRFFRGDLDDFAIWRRPLQPIEVAAITRGPPRH
jgi:hypothetical protein